MLFGSRTKAPRTKTALGQKPPDKKPPNNELHKLLFHYPINNKSFLKLCMINAILLGLRNIYLCYKTKVNLIMNPC
jgi:hypothetical protein